ncbi:radical SAM additional 4Fe4S-binding SPASM domain-containing protein [Caminicella sporogenes DSM 14501]|uniref:Radical SAM additional 4Fe4S-binding SPASM domain-containing protein n=1 Tax=Caminicella sporogenes DSM 14501 TaxID=1121266 RepID=A0A1M6R4J9_9FIRM|nr:radical SAM protein [Caminicella sporogenes]RKD27308.1 hypothetical protein BET04_09205 [Caminicella sporogenes]SHK27411.1 radical SAM additional 4Fe4S-binding SPASM domain-containing protein [Caminicella sporogenes DSM 14501]
MYPIVKKKIFLRDTPKETYIIHENNYFQIEKEVIELLNLINGTNSINDIYQYFRNKYTKEEINDILNFLKEQNIIEFSKNPNKQKIHIFEDEAYPTSLNIEVTYNCNMNCEHCMVDYSQKKVNEISFNDIDNILLQMDKLNINVLTITGGEPLLKKDLVLYTVKKCSEKNIDVTLLTNGFLFDINTIKELHEAGLNKVQISLDSVYEHKHDKIRNKPGSYKKVLSSISNLKKYNVKEVALSMTITQKNFDEVPAFIDFCVSNGVLPRIAPIVPIQKGINSNLMLTKKQLVDLYKFTHSTSDNKISATLVASKKCSIGSSPVINPCGDIFPCMHMKFNEFKLGNIRNSNLEKIWTESEILKYLKEITRSNIENCKDCWNRYLCNNCLGEIYSLTGKLKSNNPYRCAANKEITKYIILQGDEYTKNRVLCLIEGDIN